MEELKNHIENELKDKFQSDFISAEVLYDFPVFTVKKDAILNILQFLNEQAGFSFLTDICGVHFPDHESDQQFSVVYHLHNLPKNHRIRLKVFLSASHPSLPSATPLYATANWLERETYDFYGIEFKGHPNLKKILNMEDQPYFPMRKEFPLEDGTREDKDDKMFGR